MTVAERLRSLGAHHDLVSWAGEHADWRGLWEACPRGDWLLAIAARLGAERPVLVRAACACARLALDQLPDDLEAPRRALEAAEGWARGQGDAGACQLAADRAEESAGSAGDPAAQAAAMACVAAARSVADPQAAPTAAAAAAQAAVFDAGDCAMMSALRYAQAECAERVRRALPYARMAAAQGW